MKIRKSFSFSIDEEMYKKFELIARSDDRSPSNLVAFIIQRTVAVYEDAFGCKDLLTGEERARWY